MHVHGVGWVEACTYMRVGGSRDARTLGWAGRGMHVHEGGRVEERGNWRTPGSNGACESRRTDRRVEARVHLRTDGSRVVCSGRADEMRGTGRRVR